MAIKEKIALHIKQLRTEQQLTQEEVNDFETNGFKIDTQIHMPLFN